MQNTWNHTPRKDLECWCPEEIFSGSFMTKEETCSSLEQLHTWGCPVYMLEDKIQEGEKPKRWESYTRTAIFLEHSSQHSNSVYLVLNPKTNQISAQYHCIFDDYFHTLRVKSESDKAVVWNGAYKKTTKLVDLNIPTNFDFTDFEVKGDTENDYFIDNFNFGNKSKKKILRKLCRASMQRVPKFQQRRGRRANKSPGKTSPKLLTFHHNQLMSRTKSKIFLILKNSFHQNNIGSVEITEKITKLIVLNQEKVQVWERARCLKGRNLHDPWQL